MTETAVMTPEPPQRLRALERANEVRLARAELKRRIAENDISAAEVILECPWEARNWPIGELLMSQRRWGVTKCRKFLSRNHIGEMKFVGTLDRASATAAGRGARGCGAALSVTSRPVLALA